MDIFVGIICLVAGMGAVIGGFVQPSHTSGMAIGLFIGGAVLVIIGGSILGILDAIIDAVTDPL